MKNSLTNKLNSVIELIDQGNYQDAIDKLNNDILKKTDGCISFDQEPDRNDWIKDCSTQSIVYPLIIETMEYLEDLL